jgi:hypothetical protein
MRWVTHVARMMAIRTADRGRYRVVLAGVDSTGPDATLQRVPVCEGGGGRCALRSGATSQRLFPPAVSPPPAVVSAGRSCSLPVQTSGRSECACV